jgi:hypothetical protein
MSLPLLLEVRTSSGVVVICMFHGLQYVSSAASSPGGVNLPLTSIDLDSEELEEELGYWQHYYNWDRPHGSIGGKTPIERCCELSEDTPFWEQVYRKYYQKKDHIQEANYYRELQVRKLKQSM